ncbi:MAG: Fe-S protein assembly co-chaperone HscB [Planctomycetes bacterium]|nr:Fe-S protein assembly co-chaperone HscB [Planctomycetota bacterium]
MNSRLFCADCRTLHPADTLDHFELLGLKRTYDIDVGELRRIYLSLSRDIHPDRFSTRSEQDSGLSMRISAQLNQAYQALSDDVRRAEYLLGLMGGKSSVEDKTVPRDVLLETLTLREEIDEARLADDEEALARCRGRVREHYDEALAQVSACARELPGTEQTRQTLRTRLNTIKYYQKLRALV